MIVKLTYSAELEEVPGEVGKIVDSTILEMEDVCRDLSGVQSDLTKKEADVKTALSKIEFAMKFVEKLDTRLKDCKSILSGYMTVLEQQKEQSTPQTVKQPEQTVKQSEEKVDVESKSARSTAKKKAG